MSPELTAILLTSFLQLVGLLILASALARWCAKTAKCSMVLRESARPISCAGGSEERSSRRNKTLHRDRKCAPAAVVTGIVVKVPRSNRTKHRSNLETTFGFQLGIAIFRLV